jgi:2-deoxystreptamine N-acetyl-D-glucosaminyltransferase/2-deoxystreptamine glucosyltransferase
VTEIETLNGPRGRSVMAVERATSRLVNAYIANSPGALEVLVAHGFDPARLHYIPNGIDATAWAPSAADATAAARSAGPPVVLCSGRFTPVKRQLDLVEAAAILRDRGVQARFRLAGSGPLQGAVADRVAALGLGAVVELPGTLDPATMADALAAADIACLPSLQEGMPGVVLEAMASGVPVVGTRVNGIRDLVVDGVTGLLVPPADPPALAAALAELLGDPQRRRAFGDAGRARALQDFSIDGMVDAYVDLYRRLARAR